jgi:hypothetical protein
MVTGVKPTEKKWRQNVSPEQYHLAGAVVEAMNRDLANWNVPHAMFDALQPKEAQLFGSEITYASGAKAPPSASGIDAARRVFEAHAMTEWVRLAWPLNYPDGVFSTSASGNALIAAWRLIREGGWQLIKRCHVCAQWTVNRGDKPDKRFCSAGCRIAWFNRQRSRRRAASRTLTRPRRAMRSGLPTTAQEGR